MSVTDAVFASAESKVKYPKLAKAPSVTVDYVKDIIKFPKGVEVKGIDNTASNTDPILTSWNEFTPSKDKATTVSIDKLLPKSATPASSPVTGKVEVSFEFTVHVAPNGKKPGSAISVVKVAQNEAWVNTAEGMDVADTEEELKAETTGYTITAAIKGADTDISLTRIVDSKTNTLKNNINDKQIEYVIVDVNTPTLSADAKWTKVGAVATKKLPADSAGKRLFVRVAGNKGNAKKNEDPVRTSLSTSIIIQTPIKEFEKFNTSDLNGVYTTSTEDKLKLQAALPKVAVAILEDGTKVNIPITSWDVTTFTECKAVLGTLPVGVIQPTPAKTPDKPNIAAKTN